MLQIRMLGPDDARAFQALRLQGLEECASAFASSYEEECETPVALIAQRLAPAPDRAVFGAILEQRLIGIVGVQREHHRKLAHKAFIWGMYVAPDGRRQGVGRQLMQRALQHAQSMPGVRQVNLGVNAANFAAMALYESFGFRSFGLERRFMQIDGELHDEVHMVWTST